MELDDMGSGPMGETLVTGSSQWCGKHAPAKPGLCSQHGIHFHELHNEEISEMFGVGAIFYCPRPGCDEIDFHWELLQSAEMDQVGRCLVSHFTNDPPATVGAELSAVVNGILRNAARLKILFLKHRQLVEKLEGMGYFEGGKKT